MRRAPSHSLLGPALFLYLVADAAAGQGQLDALGALIAALLGLLSLSSLRMARAEPLGSQRVAWLGPAAACALLRAAAPHALSLAVDCAQAVAQVICAALVLDLALTVPDQFFPPARSRRLRAGVYALAVLCGLLALAGCAPVVHAFGRIWLAPAWLARVPVCALVLALGSSLWLRLLRRRLSSSEEALASNAWAIFGLVPAVVVGVGIVAGELSAFALGLDPERLGAAIAALALLFGHVRLCDPSRRPNVGPTTRDAVAAVLALFAGALTFVSVQPVWPAGELAGAAGAVALLLFVALLYRGLREIVRVALAPFSGRLLLALERIEAQLAEATDLEGVAKVALSALREASGDPGAEPILYLFDPVLELRIDAAAQPHRSAHGLHPVLHAALREQPNEILLRAPLEAQMVRKPALRPLIDALVALDVLCVLPIYQREELEAVVLAPRGARTSRLTLEELALLARFSRMLAGTLSVLCAEARSWRRASHAIVEQKRTAEGLVELEAERARLNAEVRALRASDPDGSSVTYSQAMRALFARVEELAVGATPVLLIAERGIPLAKLARTLHERGPRAARPFVAIDASASRPEDGLALLFGDPEQKRLGLLALADDGTLLLCELCALAPVAQRALANAMAERKLRIVASCRRDPDALVAEGVLAPELRERFFARLRVPPLRDRREDLPSLILFALDRSARVLGRPVCGLEPDAHARLIAYEWPGNQVELDAVIERAVALAEGPRISLRELTRAGLPVAQAPSGHPLDGSLERIERRALRRALERADGNKSEAARLLGLKRTTFLDMLRRHGLDGQAPDERETN